ncbi:hypothetical protein SLEP1_g33780 [Rubroshorea leprosula]|uniref:RNase H type-1 domain-containing protein n=1 Tax=Rubroshorea leprosula TaxID=152421 RepID=A0AAV5KHS1_9ROSI|nr:hypothetical protein SLEP1_g33780 [Rubroshorea leprosula]
MGLMARYSMKFGPEAAMVALERRASAGGLIRDHGGQWLHGFNIKIGSQSNYMAELWGCHAGP